MTTQKNNAYQGIFVDRSQRAMIAGALASFLLVVGIGGWAVTARLSGAVVTQGSVVVASDLKSVQHPDGGIVGDVFVRNGDRVQAGDIVMKFDDQMLQANRRLFDDQLIASEARLARLIAEHDGLDKLVISHELADRSDEAKVEHALSSQRAAMAAHRASSEGQVDTHREQIAQLEEEVTGLEIQRDAAEEQVEMVNRELSNLEPLFAKGITTETRITALKRERSTLSGSIGVFHSQIAVTRGKISEIELAIMQLDKSYREQVANEISVLEPEITQLKDQRDAVDLNLARVFVRAPADGIVHELVVHTVGGVAQPGATLMQIVPEADNLLVSAAIAPKDVNHVSVGQKATLVIGAFDQKSMPKLDALVTYVSADLKMDATTGMGYYEVRAELDQNAASQLSDRNLALLPGMPSEVYIETGDRTAAEYLLEPLSKQLRSTFREI